MANELRMRQNFIGGKVEDNPLTATATTLTSAALAAVVAVGSTQHLPIILDPDGIYGEPEIAYITAHTLGATTATILRNPPGEGTTARQHKQDVDWAHGPTVKDLDGLLAYVSYNPGTVTTVSTSSTSFSDVDATNLAITFVAPPSGKVRISLSSCCYQASAGNAVFWNLRNGGADVAGTAQQVNSTANVIRVTVYIYVTGLTPGNSYTYKWGQASSTVSFAANTRYGDDGTATGHNGPAVMEAWAVNV